MRVRSKRRSFWPGIGVLGVRCADLRTGVRNDADMYPKILFFGSEPPSSIGAGSIYFFRLFQRWPVDRLKVVTPWLPEPRASRLACPYHFLKIPFRRLNKTRFWKIRLALRLFGAAYLVSLKAIKQTIEFNPDAVVTLMQDSIMYDAASRYARYIRKPLIVFVHDAPLVFEPLPGPFRYWQVKQDRNLLRKSATIFAVSPGMQKYLAKTYGAKSHVLLPSYSAELLSIMATASKRTDHRKTSGRLTLGYAGGFHYGYGEQLLTLIPTLRRIGSVIEIFGVDPTAAQSLGDFQSATDVVRFHGTEATPEEAWRKIRHSCDALLIPYRNPPGKHWLQYQTHFPSKLVDMLCVDMPIVMTGPDIASGIVWLKQHPYAGLCITTTDETQIANAIGKLGDDSTLRNSFAKSRARLLSAFDPIENERRFSEILSTVC